MKMLRNIFPALLALVFSNCVWGQGLIHAGGSIVMTDGAFVIVDGTNGNYAATSDAYISMMTNSVYGLMAIGQTKEIRLFLPITLEKLNFMATIFL
jgi:hypothetical protein